MSPPIDPSETPTQPAMPAVVVPPTTETRLRAVEDRLGTVEARVGDLEFRADTLSGRVDDGAKKHAELATKVDAIQVDVSAVKDETTKQTASLNRIEEAVLGLVKQLGGVINNPRVRFVAYALSIAITGWLASKGFRLPQ